MAPEQVAGLELTPRCDVYSLAAVAYEMLTGRPPFQANSITAVIYRVMHEAARRVRVERHAASPLRPGLRRALAKEAGARYATAPSSSPPSSSRSSS